MAKIVKKSEKKETDKILIENFVNLQRVMTNLALKFDNLSDNISKLLQLFEIAAKSFVEKQAGRNVMDAEKDKELVDKLNVLLDQNKTIAKGLTLMEQKVRERIYGDTQPSQPSQIPNQEERMDIKPRALPSY